MSNSIPHEPAPVERFQTFMGTLSAFGLLLGDVPKVLPFSTTTVTGSWQGTPSRVK